MFGDSWQNPELKQKKEAAAKAKAAADKAASPTSDAAPASAAAPDRGYLLVAFIASCILAAIVLVLLGSGGKEMTNQPKAILFVISGLQGAEFTDAVVEGPYGPNIKRIITAGAYAACTHNTDGRCCRTQDGPRFGPDFKFTSAPGIASILTGVNSNKHRVNNNSLSAVGNFRETSQQYPTILKLAKAAGRTTAVIGSKNLLSGMGADGRCSNVGVADIECGDDAARRCLARGSCNADIRVSLQPDTAVSELAGAMEKDAFEYSRAVDAFPSDSGRIFEMTNNVISFINAATDLIVVHINALETASEDKANGGDYSVDSKTAMSALYYIDSVIGQVAAIIESRVSQSRENWMLMGVSDHGGYKSQSGTTADEDELVAFFGTAFTQGGQLALREPFPPVRQYDVAPTLLKWLAVASPATGGFDGTVQMVCSDGAVPANCTKQ